MSAPERLTPYHWRLFGFLSVATFFEGYDHLALSQVLPALNRAMGIEASETGAVVAFINIGTVLAYLLVRKADHWGRRRVLTITIVGYTVSSFLSGLSPNIWVFAALQMIARVFLIGEWVVSMMYAAEEFPSEKRGLMLGLIQAFSSLGAVVCAGVVPLIINGFPDWLGWRIVYFIGTIPLVLLAVGRRSLRESSRYLELDPTRERPSFFRIFRTPYRTRMLQLALIWGLTYLCSQTVISFWKLHAMTPAPAFGPHLTEQQAGSTIVVAAVVAMPLVFLAGKLIDWLGRRIGAVVVFLVTSVSCVGAYAIDEAGVLLTLSVTGAVFGLSAVLPVLNAYSTELFPTELRGDAFAWSNNLLGRISYVASPVVVGALAETYGWAPVVASTAVGPVLALALILFWMPETRGKSLEETSRVDA